MTCVVDASVGAKWFFPESHSDLALRLRAQEPDLHVPSLFDLELANIVWKRVRRGEILETDGRLIVDAMSQMPLVRHPVLPTMRDAFELAIETDRTVYDSAYVALAKHLGCRLVTADERLHNALVSRGHGALSTLLEHRH